jgi:MFS family permease
MRMRDFDPRVLRIFLGFGFSALGSGLTMPFLFVYLAEVRGFPTPTVGLIFAWMGLVGLCLSPIGGTLIDRFGPRPVMLSGLVVEASSVVAIGHIEQVWEGFALATVMVAGTIGLWPASTAMLTRLVPPAARERVYGVNFMLLNAGLGVGGLVSALIVDVTSVKSFQVLYLIDGLSYLVYLAVLISLPRGTGAQPVAAELEPHLEPPSWRVVLRDRTLMRVVLTSTLAVTFGYAQMEAGFAAYAVTVADVPARALGLAFGANTGAIVIGQLIALRLIRGRRRSMMLSLCAFIWSVSWLIIASSDATSGAISIALVVLGLGLFGVGETLWAPVAPAIVNDLAREDMRGRYNALSGMTWTVSSIIGPLVAGMLIGHGLAYLWVACVAGGTGLAAVLFAGLRSHLTDAQDGVGASPSALPSATA